MESMKSSPSRVCERGDGEPRAVSAQRSRQQAGSNAGQAVGYAAEATEAGRAAEGSAERTTLSSATPMVLRIVGENNIIGSRHFQSLEEQSLRVLCVYGVTCHALYPTPSWIQRNVLGSL